MAVSIQTNRGSSAGAIVAQSKKSTVYLYGGAASEEQRIAIAVLNGRMDMDQAVDKFIPMVEQAIADQAKTALKGLHTAFIAIGDWDRAKAVADISKLAPDAWERFDELTAGLRLSLSVEGLTDHVALVDTLIQCNSDLSDYGVLSSAALQWLLDEQARAQITPPVRMHASLEMRNLLAVPTVIPDPESVRWLLANRTADNQPIPGKYYKAFDGATKRVSSFELCFSPSKSVSVEWAFSGDARRASIRAVQEMAVTKAMSAVAEHLGQVRLGKSGSKGMEKGEIAWIAFGGGHTYSRKGDPQIHTHVIILNVVCSLESHRVGSLPLRELHGEFAGIKQIYQQELGRGLAALGIANEYDQRLSATVVTGIPDPLLEAMGQRRAEATRVAVETAAAKGIDFDQLTEVQQSRWINNMSHQTRQAKEPDPPDFHEWVARAVEAVGTEEWNRMADARGWTRHDPRAQQIAERVREGRDRNSAGLAAEYNRGGSRVYDWEIAR